MESLRVVAPEEEKEPSPFLDERSAAMKAAYELDVLSDELQDKAPFISVALDKIANTLEAAVITQREIGEPLSRRGPLLHGQAPRREPREVPIGQPSDEDTRNWEELVKEVVNVSEKMKPLTHSKNPDISARAKEALGILEVVRKYSQSS